MAKITSSQDMTQDMTPLLASVAGIFRKPTNCINFTITWSSFCLIRSTYDFVSYFQVTIKKNHDLWTQWPASSVMGHHHMTLLKHHKGRVIRYPFASKLKNWLPPQISFRNLDHKISKTSALNCILHCLPCQWPWHQAAAALWNLTAEEGVTINFGHRSMYGKYLPTFAIVNHSCR